MNILILDDDMIAVKAITSVIDKEKHNISNILPAYSVMQAKKLFLEYDVEIAICDIEIPGESGFDFIEWLRENNLRTMIIMLTSHADFSYARHAIKIGAISYLLKPIIPNELDEAIAQSIDMINSRKNTKNQENDAYRWNIEKRFRAEVLFNEIISGIVAPDIDNIMRFAKARDIDINADRPFAVVLVSIKRPSASVAEWTRSDFEFAFKNITYEILNVYFYSITISRYDNGFVILIDVKDKTHGDVIEACGRLISAYNAYLNFKACCYVSEICRLDEIYSEYKNLKKHEYRNVAYDNLVLDTNKTIEKGKHSEFDLNYFESLFLNSSEKNTLNYMKKYLSSLKDSNALDVDVLEKLRQDLTQSIFSILKDHGIQAHLQFKGSDFAQRLEKSTYTVESFIEWFEYTINRALNCINLASDTTSIIDKTRQFILNNIDKPIGRNDIAAHVCLSPDYFSRLFKKETGVSFVQYLNDIRIKKAKEYLANTDIPISNIAQMVGSVNFSYFSTIFKKATGMSPLDYRKQFQKGKEKNDD